MKLAHLAWPDVAALDPETVVLIPTGALEQHGPHLPLFTDTLLVTAVAEAVERAIPDRVLLLPTQWQGASAHHLPFAGTVSADTAAYIGTLKSTIASLSMFRRFFVINGHGGNDALNEIVLRDLKAASPNRFLAAVRYDELAAEALANILTGPWPTMQHACEAETSLMMHLHPDLVRYDRIQRDGLTLATPVPGVIANFDEITERGNLGASQLATPEKGQAIFAAAVDAAIRAVQNFAGPTVYQSLFRPE